MLTSLVDALPPGGVDDSPERMPRFHRTSVCMNVVGHDIMPTMILETEEARQRVRAAHVWASTFRMTRWAGHRVARLPAARDEVRPDDVTVVA